MGYGFSPLGMVHRWMSSWMSSVTIGSRLSFMEKVWLGAEEGVGSFDALELTREW